MQPGVLFLSNAGSPYRGLPQDDTSFITKFLGFASPPHDGFADKYSIVTKENLQAVYAALPLRIFIIHTAKLLVKCFCQVFFENFCCYTPGHKVPGKCGNAGFAVSQFLRHVYRTDVAFFTDNLSIVSRYISCDSLSTISRPLKCLLLHKILRFLLKINRFPAIFYKFAISF